MRSQESFGGKVISQHLVVHQQQPPASTAQQALQASILAQPPGGP